jgi:membrane protein required for colicin V production
VSFDLVIALVVLSFALWGMASGAARQVAQLAATVLAWLVARPLGEALGPLASRKLGSPHFVGTVVATFVGFLLIFLAAWALLTLFLRRLLAGRDPKYRAVDRTLGFLLGGTKVALFVYVGMAAASFVESNVVIAGHRLAVAPQGSVLYAWVRKYNVFELQQFGATKDLLAVAKLTQDPKAADRLKDNPDFLALKKDPRFKSALDAEGLKTALESGNPGGLLKSNAILELLSDPAAADRLARLSRFAEH